MEMSGRSINARMVDWEVALLHWRGRQNRKSDY